MQRNAVLVVFLMGSLVVSSNTLSGRYQEQEGGRPALAKAVAGAKISLEQGLDAVSREGKPLSARFEIEDGMLQLSVYREKGDQLSEVILDPLTGSVAEVDPITSGGDYTVAQDRSAAMAKAKQSLRTSLSKVLKGNPGFHAVSIYPVLEDGHPVAEVTLAMGDKWKTVLEKLD